jgi:type IV secretory pathway VirB6-like protein
MTMRKTRIVSMLAGLALLCLPLETYAQAQPITQPLSSSCTNNSAFDPDTDPGAGVVTTIVNQVQTTLNTLASTLFTTINSSSSFTDAIGALITLYVGIYGILFAFGMARETTYEFAVRVMKIIVVAFLVNGGAWQLFYDNVVQLFNTGVNDLITTVTSVAVAPGAPSAGPPASILDEAINKVFSSKMVVQLFTMATTGMYGIVHALLAAFAIYSLVGMLLLAIWIYLMSMILRTLLFGLAPIFLAFLLFDRTKPVFLGWLNQIISVCLQPIFLFTFLSFFLVLINATMDDILITPVCWTQLVDSMRGAPFALLMPRFAIPDLTNTNWLQYNGQWGPYGPDTPLLNNLSPLAPIYPIDIVAILTFLLLTQLGKRFSEAVLLVARDMAAGSVNLMTMQSGLQQFFMPSGSPSTPASVSERVGPGGRSGAPADVAVQEAAANRTSRSLMQGVQRIASQVLNNTRNIVNPPRS